MTNFLKGFALSSALLLGTCNQIDNNPTEKHIDQQTIIAADIKQTDADKDMYSKSLDEIKGYNIENLVKKGVYCIRDIVWYESPTYGKDGQLYGRKSKSVAHGSGFAFRYEDGWYYILTNNHVACSDDTIGNFGLNSKKLEERVMIVNNERDAYEKDSIPLEKVLCDKKNDIAILRTRQKLNIIPYRIGSSKNLKEGDVVVLAGFPFGLVKSVTYGKVNSTSYNDIDLESGDNHYDFIVDLSAVAGNSGSPVFTVLENSRELALVGVFHSAVEYGPDSLKLVVGIDNFVNMLRNLKKDEEKQGTKLDCHKLIEFLNKNTGNNFYRLGNRMGRINMFQDELKVTIYSGNYPLDNISRVEIYGKPALGGIEKVIIRNPSKTLKIDTKDIQKDFLSDLDRVYDTSCSNFLDLVEYSNLLSKSQSSKELNEQSQRKFEIIVKELQEQSILTNSLDYIVDRLSE